MWLCGIRSVVLRCGWECFLSLSVMLMLGDAGSGSSGSTWAPWQRFWGALCCLVPEGWDSSIPAIPLTSISLGCFSFWTSSLRFNILSPLGWHNSLVCGSWWDEMQVNFDDKLHAWLQIPRERASVGQTELRERIFQKEWSLSALQGSSKAHEVEVMGKLTANK